MKKNQKGILDDLFMEGVNIRKNAKTVNDCTGLSDLRRQYYLWVHSIRDFCEENKIKPQIKYLFYGNENDDVLETSRRGCGINFQDNFCQKLLRDILKETKLKLGYLSKIELSVHQITKEKNDKPKFPYKLIAGTTWGNIVITFSDDEKVTISAMRKVLQTNYENMGFLDGRYNYPHPDEDWCFLKLLAKLYGEISTKDRERDDKYKKRKQALSEALKYYFSISDDPFYPYKEYIPGIKDSNSYKIRITLIYPEKEKPREIKSYLTTIDDISTGTPQDEFEREIDEIYKQKRLKKTQSEK